MLYLFLTASSTNTSTTNLSDHESIACVPVKTDSASPVFPEPALDELRKLSRELTAIRLQMDEHFRGTEAAQEWEMIGTVMDRLLFGLYVVFILVSFITIISIWIWNYSMIMWQMDLKIGSHNWSTAVVVITSCMHNKYIVYYEKAFTWFCNYRKDEQQNKLNYKQVRTEEPMNAFKSDLPKQNWEVVYKTKDFHKPYGSFLGKFKWLYDRNCPIKQ